MLSLSIWWAQKRSECHFCRAARPTERNYREKAAQSRFRGKDGGITPGSTLFAGVNAGARA
jgi:hypothetical protein